MKSDHSYSPPFCSFELTLLTLLIIRKCVKKSTMTKKTIKNLIKTFVLIAVVFVFGYLIYTFNAI